MSSDYAAVRSCLIGKTDECDMEDRNVNRISKNFLTWLGASIRRTYRMVSAKITQGSVLHLIRAVGVSMLLIGTPTVFPGVQYAHAQGDNPDQLRNEFRTKSIDMISARNAIIRHILVEGSPELYASNSDKVAKLNELLRELKTQSRIYVDAYERAIRAGADIDIKFKDNLTSKDFYDVAKRALKKDTSSVTGTAVNILEKSTGFKTGFRNQMNGEINAINSIRDSIRSTISTVGERPINYSEPQKAFYLSQKKNMVTAARRALGLENGLKAEFRKMSPKWETQYLAVISSFTTNDVLVENSTYIHRLAEGNFTYALSGIVNPQNDLPLLEGRPPLSPRPPTLGAEAGSGSTPVSGATPPPRPPKPSSSRLARPEPLVRYPLNSIEEARVELELAIRAFDNYEDNLIEYFRQSAGGSDAQPSFDFHISVKLRAAAQRVIDSELALRNLNGVLADSIMFNNGHTLSGMRKILENNFEEVQYNAVYKAITSKNNPFFSDGVWAEKLSDKASKFLIEANKASIEVSKQAVVVASLSPESDEIYPQELARLNSLIFRSRVATDEFWRILRIYTSEYPIDFHSWVQTNAKISPREFAAAFQAYPSVPTEKPDYYTDEQWANIVELRGRIRPSLDSLEEETNNLNRISESYTEVFSRIVNNEHAGRDVSFSDKSLQNKLKKQFRKQRGLVDQISARLMESAGPLQRVDQDGGLWLWSEISRLPIAEHLPTDASKFIVKKPDSVSSPKPDVPKLATAEGNRPPPVPRRPARSSETGARPKVLPRAPGSVTRMARKLEGSSPEIRRSQSYRFSTLLQEADSPSREVRLSELSNMADGLESLYLFAEGFFVANAGRAGRATQYQVKVRRYNQASEAFHSALGSFLRDFKGENNFADMLEVGLPFQMIGTNLNPIAQVGEDGLPVAPSESDPYMLSYRFGEQESRRRDLVPRDGYSAEDVREVRRRVFEAFAEANSKYSDAVGHSTDLNDIAAGALEDKNPLDVIKQYDLAVAVFKKKRLEALSELDELNKVDERIVQFIGQESYRNSKAWRSLPKSAEALAERNFDIAELDKVSTDVPSRDFTDVATAARDSEERAAAALDDPEVGDEPSSLTESSGDELLDDIISEMNRAIKYYGDSLSSAMEMATTVKGVEEAGIGVAKSSLHEYNTNIFLADGVYRFRVERLIRNITKLPQFQTTEGSRRKKVDIPKLREFLSRFMENIDFNNNGDVQAALLGFVEAEQGEGGEIPIRVREGVRSVVRYFKFSLPEQIYAKAIIPNPLKSGSTADEIRSDRSVFSYYRELYVEQFRKAFSSIKDDLILASGGEYRRARANIIDVKKKYLAIRKNLFSVDRNGGAWAAVDKQRTQFPANQDVADLFGEQAAMSGLEPDAITSQMTSIEERVNERVLAAQRADIPPVPTHRPPPPGSRVKPSRQQSFRNINKRLSLARQELPELSVPARDATGESPTTPQSPDPGTPDEVTAQRRSRLLERITVEDAQSLGQRGIRVAYDGHGRPVDSITRTGPPPLPKKPGTRPSVVSRLRGAAQQTEDASIIAKTARAISSADTKFTDDFVAASYKRRLDNRVLLGKMRNRKGKTIKLENLKQFKRMRETGYIEYLRGLNVPGWTNDSQLSFSEYVSMNEDAQLLPVGRYNERSPHFAYSSNSVAARYRLSPRYVEGMEAGDIIVSGDPVIVDNSPMGLGRAMAEVSEELSGDQRLTVWEIDSSNMGQNAVVDRGMGLKDTVRLVAEAIDPRRLFIDAPRGVPRSLSLTLARDSHRDQMQYTPKGRDLAQGSVEGDMMRDYYDHLLAKRSEVESLPQGIFDEKVERMLRFADVDKSMFEQGTAFKIVEIKKSNISVTARTEMTADVVKIRLKPIGQIPPGVTEVWVSKGERSGSSPVKLDPRADWSGEGVVGVAKKFTIPGGFPTCR